MNTSRSRVIGAVIYSVFFGPMSLVSFSGIRYFIYFIDEYSGYVLIQPIVQKSDALQHSRFSQAWVGSTNGRIINQPRHGNGSDHLEIKGYIREKGI